MTLGISGVDLSIVILYFAVVFGIGIYCSRKTSTSTGYFLAGRDLGWFAVGASLFAANISSEHFIGLAGSGASSGLAVGQFELFACICCLLLGWIFVPFYIRSGVFTMPEFLERRYNRASRTYLTIISLIAYVATKISVTLYAGGLVLRFMFGWDSWKSSIFMVLATGVYTIVGGLAAVVYTELIQTFVLIGGALLLTGIGIHEVGGVGALIARTPPDYFSMFKPMSHPDFPWTGMIFGLPILGIWYWCTDQYIVQRVLGAKNYDHARCGAIFAGFLKLLPLFILVLPGVVAHALFPGIDPDQAYPKMTELLPVGAKGVVVAGLLAALMSSLSACFNSCSTLFTIDLYKRIRPLAGDRELVNVGRLATVAMVLLGMLWVPLITYMSNQVYVYLQSIQGYISPPIAAVFLFGLFWKRLNGTGAFASLLTGFILGMGRFILEIVAKRTEIPGAALHWFATTNFLHVAIFLFVACSFVLVIVSLMTRAPEEDQIRGLTYSTVLSIELGAGSFMKRAAVVSTVLLIIILIAIWSVMFRPA